MPPKITDGIARIVKANSGKGGDAHIGMGFVVGPRHIMTCCHVINDFLGNKNRLDPARPPLGTQVEIRFPYAGKVTLTGIVANWGLAPPLGLDVAVLEIVNETVPENVGIAIFSEEDVDKRQWFCRGFDKYGKERETKGICGPILADETRQLNGPEGAAAMVEGGYSGGTVWSDFSKSFVGMVALKDPAAAENHVAYAIPVSVLKTIWPQLWQWKNGIVIKPNATQGRKAHLIDDDIVVLDREDIFDCMQRIRAKAAIKRVVLIRGLPRSGKTHCKHLFELAAREESALPVYLDRDLITTVDDAVALLFSAAGNSNLVPPRDSTSEAWYGTIFRKLCELTKQTPMWVAIDDLGLDSEGQPLMDTEVRKFFDQFVLQMKNPAIREPFRLMLIHYPTGNLPTRWDRNILFEKTVDESDVKREHVIALLEIWLERRNQKMTAVDIENLAADIITKAETEPPPGEQRRSRLERIHEELKRALKL